LAIIWRVHDKGNAVLSEGWLSNLSIYGPAAVIAGAVLLAAFLLYESRQPKSEPRFEQATSHPSSLTVPTIGLTLRSASIDPYDSVPGRNFPRKLTLHFSNDGDEIHLGIAKWIKDQVGIQIGKPPTVAYYLKNNLGRWDYESSDKVVPSGRWVKMWVGLDSSMPDSELKKLIDESRLGVLEIPAEVSGVPVKIRTGIVCSGEVLSKL
jgi:hypothetical protein